VRLFQFWGELGPLWRYGLPILLLAISTGIWLAGWFWPWGWAVGGVMLLFAGPSDSQKKGYRF